MQEEDGETVKEDGGEDAQETRFFLPGMPSSHIMVLLLAVSRELQRAGGIAPGSTALLTLRHQLGQAIISTYKCAFLYPLLDLSPFATIRCVLDHAKQGKSHSPLEMLGV